MESPHHGNVTERLRRPVSTRDPPVSRMKKTARAQVITLSVSSHPAMSCHAGKLNRKKSSGLVKIGSTKQLLVRGANQKRASDGHSVIMAPPVTAATMRTSPHA